ncbi:hypothetical protein ACLOJK_030213, partial [Asimina triloba]
LAFFFLAAAAAVSAQDGDFAPAPSPSFETGAGFSHSFSPALLFSSLLLSLFALLLRK